MKKKSRQNESPKDENTKIPGETTGRTNENQSQQDAVGQFLGTDG